MPLALVGCGDDGAGRQWTMAAALRGRWCSTVYACASMQCSPLCLHRHHPLGAPCFQVLLRPSMALCPAAPGESQMCINTLRAAELLSDDSNFRAGLIPLLAPTTAHLLASGASQLDAGSWLTGRRRRFGSMSSCNSPQRVHPPLAVPAAQNPPVLPRHYASPPLTSFPAPPSPSTGPSPPNRARQLPGPVVRRPRGGGLPPRRRHPHQLCVHGLAGDGAVVRARGRGRLHRVAQPQGELGFGRGAEQLVHLGMRRGTIGLAMACDWSWRVYQKSTPPPPHASRALCPVLPGCALSAPTAHAPRCAAGQGAAHGAAAGPGAGSAAGQPAGQPARLRGGLLLRRLEGKEGMVGVCGLDRSKNRGATGGERGRDAWSMGLGEV